MSNIYIQEPPTSGKILLKTTAGDIDIELWSREAPLACRNFIQLCMEGYYNGTIFHRVVKGFIAQGGDPHGDGTGGESIYGKPFKDEFHTRLRFCRRGLVAMANSGRDDNASQFFFTLGEAQELQNKHTIFGKVGGDTIYNVLKMEDGDIDANERPVYPYKIIKTEILLNPFDDIVPRKSTRTEKDGEKRKSKKEKGVKNFGLLSFGEEAEEDETETNDFVQKNAAKSKSVHDIIDDPKLSKEAVHIEKKGDYIEERHVQSDGDANVVEKTDRVRDKLKKRLDKGEKRKIEPEPKKDDSNSDSDEYTNELERARKLKRQKKADEIRNEIKALKKEYKTEKMSREVKEEKTETKEKEHDNEMVEEYLSEQRKYGNLKKEVPKKGAEREAYTLKLLSKFKTKLNSIKSAKDDDEEDTSKNDVDDEELNTDKWMSHTLKFDEMGSILAKDAATKKDDWYADDIANPQNPINKRKRGEDGRRDKDRHRHRR
ncbi:spliceosome-associated protein CWC27 homolog [Contarinia nasturtii]|uniref:spliceosome-associated protein CWC27 homolog n=1 Tax=Contarinia nasturtii TaxID=265458 RepID=UPI0012D41730|nr:spliceosome-associated protein CWC27 homolog [Contarinia nasturtii]